MGKIVAVVCAIALVIALNSEKCFSLEYNLENSDNEISSRSAEGFIVHNELPTDIEELERKRAQNFFLVKFVGSSIGKPRRGPGETEETTKKRVVRQAYQGQAQLYPNLPSGPPYGLEPYPNHNNPNPSYNPQWQPSHNNNNNSHWGYPSQTNGYQPNYNNPYGTNTQTAINNHTQPGYPISVNGYKPSNFSYNPPQNPWQPQHPPNNGQRPYYPSNGNYPTYNNNVSNPYPGYKPANTNYSTSGRPPYVQPGQNNSYSGYPPNAPSYRPVVTPNPYPYNPNQRPQYNPGQSQLNNTRYPQGVPSNQHPVIHDDSTNRPGQNPYGSYNASSWAGHSMNNTYGRPPNNAPNGQNPQYYNSYPGSPGYTSQNYTNPYNVPNQRPPYQGQYPPNNYPGNPSGSNTFNFAINGYNPSIPNKPPYGYDSPYGNAPYENRPSQNPYLLPNGTLLDPTKVSPQHFNSY